MKRHSIKEKPAECTVCGLRATRLVAVTLTDDQAQVVGKQELVVPLCGRHRGRDQAAADQIVAAVIERKAQETALVEAGTEILARRAITPETCHELLGERLACRIESLAADGLHFERAEAQAARELAEEIIGGNWQ